MISKLPLIAATVLTFSLVTVAKAAAAEIGPLLETARSASGSGNHAAAIEALQKALEAVRTDAPLTAAAFVTVTRPAAFYGDYAARPDAVFGSGEPLQFYLEPKNLVYARGADGSYLPAFEVDLEIATEAGQSIGRQQRFASFQVASKSAIQDIFLNLKVTLTGAPPGGYRVSFVVRDLNSSKTATFTQAIMIR